jgi:serine protease AprX
MAAMLLIAGAISPATAATKPYDPTKALGSLYNVVDQIGARELWLNGFTGEGIDVAVIDTGVAPVPALSEPDKVVAMVDLSFEADVPEAVYLDTNGHGTHVAGIIAGHEPGADPATAASSPGRFLGVAPGAGIVSVKVGDNTGAVDVSQVIAGIDWVVEHAHDGDLNIRVLNLSYGTDGHQPYRIDPLARAVERAWLSGIVVVVASGNDGWKKSDGLSNPAYDPYVIAVGAAEAVETGDGWALPTWSSGDVVKGERGPDFLAPGAHIDSLRDPGSRIDVEHPEGFVTDTVFRGSGTSQAAAVASGAAALLLDARPELSPDQVKGLLRQSAKKLKSYKDPAQGAGMLNVAKAATKPAPDAVQTWERSTGLGSLEASRGDQHVTLDGTVLQGEVTAAGAAWDPKAWVDASNGGGTWTGGTWDGARWTGASWTGASWTGASWTGASWTGARWTGARWTGASWTGASWTGASWT